MQRAEGYPGLAGRCALAFGHAPRAMDLSLIYKALADGQVDLIAGDATSALIDALDLTALDDTRRYFPPYDAVPVVRSAALLRHPELGRALRRLAPPVPQPHTPPLNPPADLD